MNPSQVNYDLYHDYGTDLIYSASNDLQNVSGLVRSQQRVVRRLLTNPGDYIFHPTYGAGLPSFVGKGLTNDVYAQIQSLILANIFMEATVSQIPTPVITLQTIQGGLLVQISYTVNSYNEQVVLTFTVQ